MTFIKQYNKYFIIIIISCALGLVRWFFLDKDLPLFTLSENQLKALDLSKSVKNNNSSLLEKDSIQEFSYDNNKIKQINFDIIKQIAFENSLPIIDARDLESYNEGHIGLAYNIDSELLIEGDEQELIKFKSIVSDIINQGHKNIVVYCWNPDCDRAEYLKAILLDESGYYGSFNEYFDESNILIYEEGWDEWDLLSNPN